MKTIKATLMNLIRPQIFRQSVASVMQPEFKIINGGISSYLRDGINVSFLNFASIGVMEEFPAPQLGSFFFGCDGGLLSLLCKLQDVHTSRASFDFTSLAHQVFKHCVEQSKTVYLVGAHPLEIAVFSEKLKR